MEPEKGSDTDRKSPKQGCKASRCQSPAWPQALPGAQCLSHIQPTPAWTWQGEVPGTYWGTVGTTGPCS